MDSRDQIRIVGLKFETRLGVPAEERAGWQTVEAHLVLLPNTGFSDLEEQLVKTIDYAAVQSAVLEIGKECPRVLLETLAEDVARGILESFPNCESIQVEIRKFILENTDHVSVNILRSRR